MLAGCDLTLFLIVLPVSGQKRGEGRGRSKKLVRKKERRNPREFEKDKRKKKKKKKKKLPPFFVRGRHEGTSHRHTGTGKSKNTPSSSS
jgi:hypothetical protein